MRVFCSFNARDMALAERTKQKIIAAAPHMDVFFSPVSLRPGFWLPVLSAQIQSADAFLLLIGPNGVGPWQEIEYYEAFDAHVRDRAFCIVPVILEGANAPGLPFLRQLNWIETSSSIDPARIVAALAGVTSDRAPQLWKLVDPYRGLAAMTEADTDYFFGREQETRATLQVLASPDRTLPMLIGASGVGKSSIARAGVLAALKAMRMPACTGQDLNWPATLQDSRSWLTLVMRPGDAAIRALVDAFLSFWRLDLRDPDQAILPRKWTERLRSGDNSIADLIDATRQVARSQLPDLESPAALGRMLLYIDQAEELYAPRRHSPAAAIEAQRFSELVANAIQNGHLAAFGSLRADFYDRLQADQALFAITRRIDVVPLDEPRLLTVITEPARMVQVHFEDERQPVLLAAAAGREPGALPLLSYLMTDLWRSMVARADGVLRLSPMALDIGGLLASRAEEFITAGGAGDVDRRSGIVRKLLTLRLASVLEEGPPMRRSTSPQECSTGEWEVVRQLADYPWRLVVIHEHHGGRLAAEVAHEALLRAWPRLDVWLRDERDFLIFKAEAERRQRQWVERGRIDVALLSGLDLIRAREWLQSRGAQSSASTSDRGEDLAEDVLSYIVASIDADRDAKDRRLREQQRQNRVLRRWIAVAATIAVMAIGSGGVAIWQWRLAEANRLGAEASIEITKMLEASLLGRPTEPKQVIALMEKLTQTNDVVAMIGMGALYRRGEFVGRDLAKAQRWYERAAALGDPRGLRALADLLFDTSSDPVALQRAEQLYLEAAAKGDTLSMTSLGIMTLRGTIRPSDPIAAREWIRKAAALGDVDAMFELGIQATNGPPVLRDPVAGRAWIEKAEAAGHVGAATELGYMYANGNGVPQNHDKARSLYLKAAGRGDPVAMSNLGLQHLDGEGTSKSPAQARDWFLKAANLGYARGMVELGHLLVNGTGGPVDFDGARLWYARAAELGDAVAMTNMGLLYVNGEGVDKDSEVARHWFAKAAARNDSRGMLELGVMLIDGVGGDKQVAKGLELIQDSAEQDFSSAMYELGWRFDQGEGVPTDAGKARDWYSKAAARGNALAMTNLGLMFLSGRGGEEDHQTAITWFEKAAELGYRGAMFELGTSYRYGEGVPVDHTKMFMWLERAAALDDVRAMIALAEVYRDGIGTAPDPNRARQMLQDAVEKGSKKAQEVLQKLNEANQALPPL